MSEFEAIFGDPARPQQVDALHQLEVVDATDVVVAEGPTGIGKSRIAMMHAMYMLEKTPSLHRIIYACHTKKSSRVNSLGMRADGLWTRYRPFVRKRTMIAFRR